MCVLFFSWWWKGNCHRMEDTIRWISDLDTVIGAHQGNRGAADLPRCDWAEAAPSPALPIPAQVASDLELLPASNTPPSPSPKPSTVCPPSGHHGHWAESQRGLGNGEPPHQNKVLPSAELKAAPASGETVSEKDRNLPSDRRGVLAPLWPGAEVVENAWQSGTGWGRSSSDPY